MRKITLDEAIELYDNGDFTLEGVYNACETDLEMYNFLGGCCGYSEDIIKEKMREVSGADDAYYNALSMSDDFEYEIEDVLDDEDE